jgi:hypothetical protein
MKEEIKLSLFCRYRIFYIKDPKHSTNRLLDPIYTFSKVAGYKIHIQEPTAFLCTNNELAEKEVRKAIPFTIASKKNGIKLAKDVKDFYMAILPNAIYKSKAIPTKTPMTLFT